MFEIFILKYLFSALSRRKLRALITLPTLTRDLAKYDELEDEVLLIKSVALAFCCFSFHVLFSLFLFMPSYVPLLPGSVDFYNFN